MYTFSIYVYRPTWIAGLCSPRYQSISFPFWDDHESQAVQAMAWDSEGFASEEKTISSPKFEILNDDNDAS